MTSPYPGNPSPQQPQGGSPYGGGRPPEKKKPWPWILGICGCLALVLVLAGAGGVALFVFSGGDDDPTASPTTGTTTEEPTDDPTTEEPTTEEPTTEEPTSEDPTTEGAGLPGLSGHESTPVQDPTEEDLAAAKETMLGYLTGLSDNDPAASCALQLDPVTGVGIDEESMLLDSCVESTQNTIDDQELEGQASNLTVDDFGAELDADNRVVLVHNVHNEDPAPAKIAKGADGEMYVASL